MDTISRTSTCKSTENTSREPTLYSGTIMFNISLGATTAHEDVTQEEIEQACRDANILEFIQGLPPKCVGYSGIKETLIYYVANVSVVSRLPSGARDPSCLVGKNVCIFGSIRADYS